MNRIIGVIGLIICIVGIGSIVTTGFRWQMIVPIGIFTAGFAGMVLSGDRHSNGQWGK
jgi:hypothetical protein